MPGIDLTGINWEEMAQRPAPTNTALHNLFTGIDRILIKPGGSSGLYAKPNPVLFEIAGPDVIQQFATLIKINETQTGFHCMCSGTYDFQLYAGDQLRSIINYHHEISIRYDGWNGDAMLATPESLVNFMAEIGFTKPQDDMQESKRKQDARHLAETEWLAIAPKCFTTYWKEFGAMGELPAGLIEALIKEIPDDTSRIITLLKTFGKTKNFWSGYPSYENIPKEILNTMHPMVILQAYTGSDRNYKTRRGLGRYLCSWDFKQVRKKYLQYISEEVIDDLTKCFTSIGDEVSIHEMKRLRTDKERKAGKK